MTRFAFAVISLMTSALSVPAPAEEGAASRRVRIGLGAQAVPSYPGSDKVQFRPLIDFSSSRGDKPFAFEAPDESFGFSVIKRGGLGIGPALNVEGSRTARDVGAPLDKVSTTFEAGGFVQYEFSPKFRLRTEVRRGVGGHDGWTSLTGVDYVSRDGDKYLFSAGPRLTISDAQYHRAYFGVTPLEAARAGVPAYAPGGGIQAAGMTIGFLTQVSQRWGLYSYGKYDRLVGDAARSPVVRSFGQRDQFSSGLAVTYTFGAEGPQR